MCVYIRSGDYTHARIIGGGGVGSILTVHINWRERVIVISMHVYLYVGMVYVKREVYV